MRNWRKNCAQGKAKKNGGLQNAKTTDNVYLRVNVVMFTSLREEKAEKLGPFEAAHMLIGKCVQGSSCKEGQIFFV